MRGALTVEQICECVRGRVVNAPLLGARLNDIKVEGPARLQGSQPNQVSFFFSREYKNELLRANPGVLVTGEPFVEPLSQAGLPFWSKCAVIACADPYLGMAKVSEKFATQHSPGAHLPDERLAGEAAQVHAQAFVHPTANLSHGVVVGPHCTVEEGAQIGRGTILYPGVYVGAKVKIGEDCVVFPKVTLYEGVKLGNRVRLHAGVVLGADGFGYAPMIEQGKFIKHQKIYHTGGVSIGDDVEIGANSAIDRGTFSDTMVENNVKIDNMVQLGHNVRIGDGTILCGQVGIAGSANIGKGVLIGGATGIGNLIQVGDGAKISAATAISKDIPPGGTAKGNPQREINEHLKIHALLNRMVKNEKRKKE